MSLRNKATAPDWISRDEKLDVDFGSGVGRPWGGLFLRMVLMLTKRLKTEGSLVFAQLARCSYTPSLIANNASSLPLTLFQKDEKRRLNELLILGRGDIFGQ